MASKKFKLILILVVLILLSSGSILRLPGATAADQPPEINLYLSEAGISAGEDAYERYLQSHPQEAQAHFGLGVLQFFGAVEALAQDLYRYGLNPEPARQFGLPFLRLPVPANPNPETIDYQQWQGVLKTLEQNLQTAATTLGEVGDAPVKLPINFTAIRLDLNGDQRLSPQESFWQIYRLYNQAIPEELPEGAQAVTIAFDTGDGYWLRGYCNLLMAIADTILAYDTQEYFERLGQLFFADIQTPYDVPQVGERGLLNWVDAVAALHLLHFEPQVPQRLSLALAHARSVLSLRRQYWDSSLSEEDIDREWVPNPGQTSVVPATVTAEQIETWLRSLDAADNLLTGEKLLPHWRFDQSQGINLRRVFQEPGQFDLVLWVQGGAALPYLETGELTEAETWRSLLSAFGGNFIGFAIWFN